MIVAVTITFGHQAHDVALALKEAVAASSKSENFSVVALDDCSGQPPGPVPGVHGMSTPSRVGFAGAVNYLLSEFPDCSRLILINPDVALTEEGLSDLVDPSSPVSLLRVVDEAGRLENVRPLLTARAVLLGLLYREKAVANALPRSSDIHDFVECPPWAPAGTVIGIDAELLRRVPLDPDMFWLEFSDWIRRVGASDGGIEVRVSSVVCEHVGASTAVSFPVSVAASQLFARYSFVNRYGTRSQRAVLPVALAFRAFRIGFKRRSIRLSGYLFLASLGRRDWRVPS